MENEMATTENTLFDKYVSQIIKKCETLFTSEESLGKYLDLNKEYLKFKNIKGLQNINFGQNTF